MKFNMFHAIPAMILSVIAVHVIALMYSRMRYLQAYPNENAKNHWMD